MRADGAKQAAKTEGIVLREKIERGEKTCGIHIQMGEAYVADAFGQMDYDFVWVDTEHSLLDYRELNTTVRILQAHGVSAIVRVQIDDFNHTKRVLEMGPDGIIFPNIDTYEQAERALKSTYYPPKGNRGFGPVGAVCYGMRDVDEYIREQNRCCRFMQVESVRCIENLPEIIKLDFDGYIFGPCDLSASAGVINRVFCEKNLSLIKKALEILKNKNKYVGVSTGATDLKTQKFWFDLGCDMVSAGTDYDYLVRAANDNCRQMRKLIQMYGE